MDSYEREIEAWRATRISRLTAPDGWLALVGLWWLEHGDNPVGSSPGSKVLLPGNTPARVGNIRVAADRLAFEAAPGSGVAHQGAPVTTLELRDDSKGRPTVVQLGSLRLSVIRRVDRLAVRVRDVDSGARFAFRGIDYFPIDRQWRLEAGFDRYQPVRTSHVPTVVGAEEKYETPGALVFEVEGRTHRLDAFLEPGETDLFVVFADLTNEDETYGGGRYLYTKPADERGSVVLDFNRAYNPPCAFTPHATCALPLPQNRLAVRVTAGEKRYQDTAGHSVNPA